MNKFHLVAIIFLLFVSCQKEESPKPNIPDWLIPKIEELEKSGCSGCSTTQITYDKKVYYHSYCNISSCVYCNLYDSKGKLMEWNQEEFNNFVSNKKEETVIWQCGDKTN